MKLNIAKNELDFAQKPTLNKDFWQNEKLNPDVKKVIIAVVKNYLKTTNLRLSIDNIDEIEFTGSLANYNHNKFSDVDIHLLFDFSKLGNDPDFMRELLTAKAINWNNRHNVTIFGHEVELYIADAGSDHHSTGVYSVKDEQWLVKPVKDPKLSAELNLNKVKDKADKISKEIDMLAIKEELPLEKIEALKDKIRKMRESGLETGGEYSTENLAFKLLRRRGELNTLYALMNQAQDAELSLDEGTEWWKKRRKLDNKNYRELMGYVRGAKVSKKGKPYMVSPQMKLPKSGPPGVGALEEENELTEVKIPDDFKNAFLNIQSATMNFQVLRKIRYYGFTAFDPNKTYKGTISGNNINFPNSEKGNQTLTKQDFIETLEGKDKPFCGLLNCKTSTITTGGKTQTLEGFIANVGSNKDPQKVTTNTTPDQQKPSTPTANKKQLKQSGTLSVLGSGPVSQDIIDAITDKIILNGKAGDQIKISFREYSDKSTGSTIPCLLPHSYQIKRIGEDYVVSLVGKDYKKYFHPEALKINFDPTVCLFDKRIVFKISDFELLNWISGELKKAAISRIDYKPADKSSKPVSYVGRDVQLPSLTGDDIKTLGLDKLGQIFTGTPRSQIDPIFTKLSSETKTYQLTLFPKKTMWFVMDLMDVISSIRKDGISGAKSKIDFVYYKTGYGYLANVYSDQRTHLARSAPGDELKESLIKQIVDKLAKSAPSLPGGFGGEATKRAIEEVVRKVFATKLNETKSFTKKQYLSNLIDATGGSFCKSFDCSKTTIKFKGSAATPIQNWAPAAVRTGQVDKKGSVFIGNSQRFSFGSALLSRLSTMGYDSTPLKILGASVAKSGSSPSDWVSGPKKQELQKFLKDNKEKIGLIGLAFGDHRNNSSNTEIINVIREVLPNVKIVWQGAPPLWKTMDDKKSTDNIARKRNNEKIASQASQLGFEFIDPYKYITSKDGSLYRDKVHLTKAGALKLLNLSFGPSKPVPRPSGRKEKLDTVKRYSGMIRTVPAGTRPSMYGDIPVDMIKPVAEAIELAAKNNNLDPDILYAFVLFESGFNPYSEYIVPGMSRGATGLFQFLKNTGEKFGMEWKEGFYDPYKNADAAAKYALENKRVIERALGRSMTEDDHYLYYVAHNQGAGGAANLIRSWRAGCNKVCKGSPKSNSRLEGNIKVQGAGLANAYEKNGPKGFLNAVKRTFNSKAERAKRIMAQMLADNP